ncbi:flippase [Thioalkalivibrio sp. ALE23]|uniref:flippase n=1 Tax=Thioalkalivibrio sp. ALE23 TaxID=1265495 RepID=UPI001E34CB89|nr:flippase [Thioalkalivibrio sp. ALE23]
MSGGSEQQRQASDGGWRGHGLAGRLLRGGAGSLAAQIAEVLLGLVLLVLLARGLGAEGLGVYAFVLALMTLLSVPTRMGLPPLIIRETARGQASGEWAPVRGMWRWGHAVALVLSLVVALAVGGMLLLCEVEDGALRNTLLWGVLLVPLLALLEILSAALRGLRHVLAGVLPGQVIRPGLAVVFIGLLLWVPAVSLTADLAMAMMVLAAVLAFALGTLWLYRVRPLEMTRAAPEYDARAWFAAAWPMALTQGFQQINRYADVILLGILAASVDVGVYRTAAQGALMVALGLKALNMVVAPYITRLYNQGEFGKLQKMARRTAQAALAFALPSVLVFALIGEWLLVTIFGAEFGAAWLPLLILGLGQVVNAGFGSTGLLLNMTGHERDVTRVVAVAAGLNVVLNLALIPLFGVAGAAAATSVSLVVWNVWLWFVVRQRLGIRCSAF